MAHEMFFLIGGVVCAGPISKSSGKFLSCITFSNVVLCDFEVLNIKPSYTNLKANERVMALAIPYKPLLVILNELYPNLKKDIITKSCLRHNIIKKSISEQI